MHQDAQLAPTQKCLPDRDARSPQTASFEWRAREMWFIHKYDTQKPLKDAWRDTREMEERRAKDVSRQHLLRV